MSYIPTIIIKKADLEKHSERLELHYMEENNEVISYLHSALKTGDAGEIGGIKLLVCKPEFSSFSSDVRNMLHELDVEFTVYN